MRLISTLCLGFALFFRITPLTAAVSISISPTTATVKQGATKTFTATVSGSTNKAVTWSVVGTGNGSITTSGVYTAPIKLGSFTVRATSKADTTKYAEAAVTVPDVVVTVNPTSATVAQGAKQTFTATVTGAASTGVTWSVPSGQGSISSGVYTAPATAGIYTITAKSVTNTAKTATATVTVPVKVTISPSSKTLNQGASQKFTATVTGSSNTTVSWACSGGSIASDGTFTAPGSAGTYTITATSGATPVGTASATVTVPNVGVTINPTTSTVALDASRTFTATVTGTTNTAVTWTCSDGTIGTDGIWTAPSTAGTYTVTATSVADESKTATATVTVPVRITINPRSATMSQGDVITFTAEVAGSSNTAVTWSSSATGAITQAGVFTAPKAAGNYTITATAADGATKATATVTVSPVSISLNMDASSVAIGDQVQGLADVNATIDKRATWSLVSGDGEVFAMDSEGIKGCYTAPGTTGSATIQVTSVADPSKKATAILTITDNGGRPLIGMATVSPSSVVLGQDFVLSWSVSNASTVLLLNRSGSSRDVTGLSTLSLKVEDYIEQDHMWLDIQAQNDNGTSERVICVPASAPCIQSLTVTPPLADPGTNVSVVAEFSGGEGILEPGQGSITSGSAASVEALGSPDQQLVVRNAYGAETSAELGVAVRATKGVIQQTTDLPLEFQLQGYIYEDCGVCRTLLLRDGSLAAYGVVDSQSKRLGVIRYIPETDSFGTVSNLQRRGITRPLCLADGRVLFAGIQSSDVWNPATGEVTNPNYGWWMQQFSATLLADGNVLFAGGENVSKDQWGNLWPEFPCANADIWNPSKDQGVYLSGAMTIPRSHHSAIRLLDGRVLIVGGHTTTAYRLLEPRLAPEALVRQAEVFDPVTRTFTPTGSLQHLSTERTTLTLLPDGKVLVFADDVEIYDPATGVFSTISPYEHWADLDMPPIQIGDGTILTAQLNNRGSLYDPSLNQYRQVVTPSGTPFPYTLSIPSLLPNGKLFWTGLSNGSGSYHGSLMFDPQPEVSILPARTSLRAGQSVTMNGVVQGGGEVIWSVTPQDGTITSEGRFRAIRPGTYVVTATNTSGRKGYAWIEVLPLEQALVLSPANSAISGGGTVTFTATDGGAAVPAVWQASAGTIDANGLFTAPSTTGTVTITAFRSDDLTRGGSTTIQVAALPNIRSFTAIPAVASPGQPVTLLWNVDGGLSLTLDPGGVNVTGTSSLTVMPSGTTTYTLSAQNALGTTTRSLTVEASSILSISVNPSTQSLVAGTSIGFAANLTVLNGSDPSVTWQVNESGGGSITWSGTYGHQAVYTAPTTPGNYTISTVSVSDPSRKGTALVTVLPLEVTASPSYIELNPGTHIQFGYTTNAGGLTWSATGGTIQQDGWFTAPDAPGSYTVVAASAIIPSITASITVVVKSVGIYIIPSKVTLAKNGTYQFAAVSTGGGITWTAPDGGNISSTGLFTAPGTDGTYLVKATSALQPSTFATATVTVRDGGLGSGGSSLGTPPSPITGGVTVNPQVVPEADAGTYIPFSATVFGCDDPSVTWEVLRNITNPQNGTMFGQVDESGLFTAGCAGYYVVKATSKSNSQLWGTAVILVKDALTRLETIPIALTRQSYSVTALQDGRILIAGGYDGTNVLGTCYLYDQATGTFTETGALNIARSGHKATLLSDGRVLVCQGWGNRDLLNESNLHGMNELPHSEIYDPVTSAWTSLSLMSGVDAQGQTIWNVNSGGILAALDSANALLLGGDDFYGNPISYTSLFQGGGFSSQSWAQAWKWFPAVKLDDGRVFYSGGFTGLERPEGNTDSDWPIMSEARIYDPITGSRSPIGNMLYKRMGHTATLLADGRVLIVGGVCHNERGYGDIGRADQFVATNTCEIYDPQTGTFTATGSLELPRAEHAAILLPTGEVMVLGGWSQENVDRTRYYYNTMEIYNPDTGTWRVTNVLMKGDQSYGIDVPKVAILPNGSVFISGKIVTQSVPSASQTVQVKMANKLMASDAGATLVTEDALYGTTNPKVGEIHWWARSTSTPPYNHAFGISLGKDGKWYLITGGPASNGTGGPGRDGLVTGWIDSSDTWQSAMNKGSVGLTPFWLGVSQMSTSKSDYSGFNDLADLFNATVGANRYVSPPGGPNSNTFAGWYAKRTNGKFSAATETNNNIGGWAMGYNW